MLPSIDPFLNVDESDELLLGFWVDSVLTVLVPEELHSQ
jgi:hypothetical protein